MLSDIEISRQSPHLFIHVLAERLAILQHLLSHHGHYKGKFSLKLLKATPRKAGKLVLVSAITPTPLGEGKTVTTFGLSMGLNHIDQPSIATTIRQPSFGPVFGVKGGAAGGGHAQVVPMEEMNLHLTGDFHALAGAPRCPPVPRAETGRLVHRQNRFVAARDRPGQYSLAAHSRHE